MTVNFTQNSRNSAVMLLTFCLTFLCLEGTAQVKSASTQITVSGKVKDGSDGNPLPGVSVSISDSKSGAISSPDGSYTLRMNPGSTLTFSMLGYLPFSVTVKEANAHLNVTLPVDKKVLKDVVVIGYQEASRKTVTAAVTSVNPKALQDVPAPTLDALLQGRAPGLDVQNYSGEPGIRSNVVMRGNTAVSRTINSDFTSDIGKTSLARALSGPLYVIDGVPQTTEDIAAISYGSGTNTDVLAGISINDIQSIDILKDASAAAIYGSRGAGGVIIIKTKRGISGKPKIDFATYHGFTEMPQLDKVLIGAEERRAKMELINHYGNWGTLKNIPQVLTDSLNPAFNNANDYQGGMYQTGRVDNYDLSISGGNNLINYRYGFNYYNEEGIIRKSGLKRYSFSSSTGLNLSPNLQINTQIRYSKIDRPRSINDLSGGYGPFNGGYYASSALPTSLLYMTDANRDFIFGNTTSGTDQNSNDNLSISPIIEWKISSKFNFTTVISFTQTNSRMDSYTPGAVRRDGTGKATSFVDKSNNYLMSNTLQYTTTLNGSHSLNFLAGQNTEYWEYRATQSSAIGIPNDQIRTVTVLNKNLADTRSDLLQSGIQSLFLRANYGYKERYLLSAVITADASSRFGKNNRWGYFPSVSGGWVISDEPALKSASSWLTLLKLRASYGVAGRQPDGGDNYLSYNTYKIGAGGFPGSTNPATNSNYAFAYNGIPAVALDFDKGLTNNNLSWEKSTQSNLGLDVTLYNGRFNIVADAYIKNTNGGIFNLNVPVTTGYSILTANAIGIRNTGVELQLIANILKPSSKFQWQALLNLAHNDNLITSLPNGGRDIYLDKYLLRQGQPLNSYNVFNKTGIYATDGDVPINKATGLPLVFYGYPFKGGDPIWQDANGDGVLDNTDYVPAGNPNPKVTGGFGNTFSYRNFTLYVFCTFTAGRKVFNDYLAGKLSQLVPTDDGDPDPYHSLSTHSMPDLRDINYWRNPGDNAQYPSLSSVNGTRYKYAMVSSAWIESGAYFRVKNVSLSYSFNQSVLDKIHFRRLRIYALADNLFILKQSKNIPDPEQVDAFGVYSGSGYPIPRKFTLGLDLSL
ncbi:SusC/RagA family TonB-linked outer membrane protein [Chitinophaga sp.]|uniref:SusC/RagA family TonB-linked outer membrane protein n=1 Tax=Chitinophaga sp. TaxID=1869181 RepID=UPI002BDEB210|nr:SusC/RagA family TonB-linked outer membrane protein [Chitinophaga sp.]HWV66277.1 SusC/RagA family TonB-linked outer membrane protein [Chitinophaga sp.]